MVISTGDKDMAQLVNAHVTLVNTMTDTVLDEAGVAKFGVPPSLIIDLLALMGDKVDNIPGVPGVGEKTAAKGLQGFGSLDAWSVADCRSRRQDHGRRELEQEKDNAYLSYQLATIKTDVPLQLAPET